MRNVDIACIMLLALRLIQLEYLSRVFFHLLPGIKYK